MAPVHGVVNCTLRRAMSTESNGDEARPAQGAATARGAPRQYATLDDVLHVDLPQVFALLFQGLQNHIGIAFSGPKDRDSIDASDGYWGRSIRHNHSTCVQLRFSPYELAEVTPQGRCSDSVVCIAVRTQTLDQDTAVRCALLFLPGLQSTDVSFLDAASRQIGCRGLHLLSLGIFRTQHQMHSQEHRAASSAWGWAVDKNGHPAIASTHATIDYAQASSKDAQTERADGSVATFSMASPGNSVLSVAAELLGCSLPDLFDAAPHRRLASGAWQAERAAMEARVQQDARCSAPDVDNAVADAAAIVEFLSAENLLGVLNNDTFEGALPTGMTCPHGLASVISASVRIAMHPERYGLKASAAQSDVAAAAQAKQVFESTNRPLNAPTKVNRFAIDLALRRALHAAMDIQQWPGQVAQKLCYWQRVGQRLLVAIFGLPCYEPEDPQGKSAHDPILRSREIAYLENGIVGEGVKGAYGNSIFAKVYIGERQTALMNMMRSVEQFLFTGRDQNGMKLVERNDDDVMALQKRVGNEDAALKRALQEEYKGAHFESTVDSDTIFYDQFCIRARSAVVRTLRLELTPMRGDTHKVNHVNAYLVSPRQSNSCAMCKKDVGVLEGVLFATQLCKCPHCKSHMCFTCTDTFYRQLLTAARGISVKLDACTVCGNLPFPRIAH